MNDSVAEILLISIHETHLTEMIELLAAPEGMVLGLTTPGEVVNCIDQCKPSLVLVDRHVDAMSLLHDIAESDHSGELPILIVGGDYNSSLMNYNELTSLIVDQIPLHGPTLHKRVALYLHTYRLNKSGCSASFNAIMEVLPERALCINKDLTISAISRAGLRNDERRTIVGEPIENYIPDTAFEILQEKCRIIEDTRHRVQFETEMNSKIYSIEMAPIVVDNEVEGFAISSTDLSEVRKLETDAEKREKFDPITGLATRSAFNEFLDKAISRARRNSRTIAFCYVNLDHFKGINSTLGHDVGDALLHSVAERISSSVRASDIIARIGADEFGVILDEISRPEDAAAVAQKIMSSVSLPHQLGEHLCSTTASIGISFFTGGDETREELFKTADIAMIHAKDSGRNEYRFFSTEMQHKALERIRLERDLRKAIQNAELELYYQPLVDAQTEQVIALEALLRWKHSKLGMVSPAEFIPLAEETRLINSIGDWVLQNATHGNKEWWEKNGVVIPTLTVAINVSVQQLKEGSFPGHLERLIEESGIDPTQLEIEITETALMDDPEKSIETLHYIKSLGVKIAIDDFGTGYSSLAYIKRLPVDILKVDLTFVRDIGKDPKTEAIIKSTVSLAHNLGLKVVAEGVETEEQIAFLRDIKCDILQGYYFSKPLPVDELHSFLDESFNKHSRM